MGFWDALRQTLSEAKERLKELEKLREVATIAGEWTEEFEKEYIELKAKIERWEKALEAIEGER